MIPVKTLDDSDEQRKKNLLPLNTHNKEHPGSQIPWIRRYPDQSVSLSQFPKFKESHIEECC